MSARVGRISYGQRQDATQLHIANDVPSMRSARSPSSQCAQQARRFRLVFFLLALRRIVRERLAVVVGMAKVVQEWLLRLRRCAAIPCALKAVTESRQKAQSLGESYLPLLGRYPHLNFATSRDGSRWGIGPCNQSTRLEPWRTVTGNYSGCTHGAFAFSLAVVVAFCRGSRSCGNAWSSRSRGAQIAPVSPLMGASSASSSTDVPSTGTMITLMGASFSWAMAELRPSHNLCVECGTPGFVTCPGLCERMNCRRNLRPLADSFLANSRDSFGRHIQLEVLQGRKARNHA